MDFLPTLAELLQEDTDCDLWREIAMEEEKLEDANGKEDGTSTHKSTQISVPPHLIQPPR